MKILLWFDMEKDRIKTWSIIIGLLLGHYQGFNLVSTVKELNKAQIELNKTLIAVIENQKNLNKDVSRLENRADNLEKSYIDLIKTVKISK